MMPDQLIGKYPPPFAAKKGTVVKCLYRNAVCVVTSWTAAPLSWPRVQQRGQRGGSGLLVNETLVKAIRTESAESLLWLFGVSAGVVWKWRKKFGVSGTATTPGSKKSHQKASQRGADAMKAKEWTGDELATLTERLADARSRVRRSRWTSSNGGWRLEELALLGTDHDKHIAARFGRSPRSQRSECGGRFRRSQDELRQPRRREEPRANDEVLPRGERESE